MNFNLIIHFFSLKIDFFLNNLLKIWLLQVFYLTINNFFYILFEFLIEYAEMMKSK
jgi:hypothetical protein